jgi:pimeloyl-ACP methyl ester carboxylesterase
MARTQSRTFVFVHGAWHGGWVWRGVIDGLRARGHEATAVTLSGLGERRHDQGTIDLETHVADVVAHVEMEDLSNVTLVGWSYGGMVVTAAAGHLADRLSGLVYLDAFVPMDGQAAVDFVPPERRAAWDVLRDQNLPIPPAPIPFFGITDPDMARFVEPRLSPHSWRCFYQPATVLPLARPVPISYVVCTENKAPAFRARLAEMEANPAIWTATIATGHNCMMTATEETIAVLADTPQI